MNVNVYFVAYRRISRHSCVRSEVFLRHCGTQRTLYCVWFSAHQSTVSYVHKQLTAPSLLLHAMSCRQKYTLRSFVFTDVFRLVKGRDGSIGIALGYGLDDRCSRVRFSAGAGNFFLHHRVQNGSGAHPASYPMGTRGSSPRVKRPGCEADHSPPSSAEVKNAWSYTSTPQYTSMAWCLVKHKGLFTFTFYLMRCSSIYRVFGPLTRLRIPSQVVCKRTSI
jgi:hypothetical protein